MRVAGFDISTHTGMVCLDAQGYVCTRVVNFPDNDGWARAQLIARGVESFIQETQPEMAVIEGYAMGFNPKAGSFLIQLVEIGTLVRSVLHKHSILWHTIPPTVLKKYAAGKGNAKKPAIAAAVKDRWGFTSPSDDVVDAYVLARIALDIASGNTDLLKGIK